MSVAWSLLHAFWTNRLSYIGVRVMRTFVTICQLAVKKGKFASSVACTTMIPSRIWIDRQTFGAPIPSPPFCRHPSLGLSGTYALAHDDGWIPRGQRKMSRSFRHPSDLPYERHSLPTVCGANPIRARNQRNTNPFLSPNGDRKPLTVRRATRAEHYPTKLTLPNQSLPNRRFEFALQPTKPQLAASASNCTRFVVAFAVFHRPITVTVTVRHVYSSSGYTPPIHRRVAAYQIDSDDSQ